MKEVYGSDLTGFSAGGFVWASEVTMNLLVPAANLVGSYYKGTLAFGSLPQGGSNNGAGGSQGGLTLNQLIEISGKAEIMKSQFHLKSGVVNHEIVYDSQQYKGEYVNDA